MSTCLDDEPELSDVMPDESTHESFVPSSQDWDIEEEKGDKSFDTQISVYSLSGSTCETGLVCVDGNNDGCESQSSVRWDSTAGQAYWILVHGASNQVGTFQLRMESDEPP